MNETPRTTCVAAIVQDGKAWWARVGDSRLYMLRGGVVHDRTFDHSHVQNLMDQGLITLEQAAVHPDRNKIFNCLGQPIPPRIDVHPPIHLSADDKIVLCSDGFWGPILPEIVAQSLEEGRLGVNIPMMMDLAEALAGRECDNLSVVAMAWKTSAGSAREAALAPPPPDEIIVDDESLAMSEKIIRLTMRARPSFKETELP